MSLTGFPHRIAFLALAPLALLATWRMAPAYGPGSLLPLFAPALYWAALRRTPPAILPHLLAGHLLAFALVTAGLWLATLIKLAPLWQALYLVAILPLLLLAVAGGRKLGPLTLLLHWLGWEVLYWSAWGALTLLPLEG